MYRAFTYRLEPTVKQAQALRRSMLLQCELYNAALEERRMSHEWLRRGISTKKVPSKYDQFKTLTGLRELRPEFGAGPRRERGSPRERRAGNSLARVLRGLLFGEPLLSPCGAGSGQSER